MSLFTCPLSHFQGTGDINAPDKASKHQERKKSCSQRVERRIKVPRVKSAPAKPPEPSPKSTDETEKEDVENESAKQVLSGDPITECPRQLDTCKENESESADNKENSSNLSDKENNEPEEEFDDMIEWEDSDDYLYHLEDILNRIHLAFFETKAADVEKRDLKTLIPTLKKEVLKGVRIVFSGVVPTNCPLHRSRAYQTAASLGAEVQTEIETTNGAKRTTHVIAARPATLKVNIARKTPDLYLLSPDWLWACAERWDHVEEQLFPISLDIPVRMKSTHKRRKRRNSATDDSETKKSKRKKDEVPEDDQPQDDAEEESDKQSDVSNDVQSDLEVTEDSPPNSPETAPSFCEGVNPLLQIALGDMAELADEVDKEMEKEDDESDEEYNGSEQF